MIEMKVTINVNLDTYADDIEREMEIALSDLMAAAADEWKAAAGRVLHTTKRRYQDAVLTKVVDPLTVQIYLDEKDWLVNALEAGHGPMLPWRTTLAGRKAFYWSGCGVKKGFKWGGARGPKDTRYQKPRKPFMDVPMRPRGSGPAQPGQCNQGDSFRRLTANNSGMWTHTGFKPIGKGGLDRPLREEVIEYIEETAPKVFRAVFDKVTI